MRGLYIVRCMQGRIFMQSLCAAAAIDIDFLHAGAQLNVRGSGYHEGVTTMLVKPLALVTSMVLLTTIAGQAAARPGHLGMQHSNQAAMSSSDHQTTEAADGTAMSTGAPMHRYMGGPKSND